MFELPRDEAMWGPILLSFRVLLVSGPLLLFLGVPLGLLLGVHHGRWSRAVDGLVSLPLFFPPIATGFLLLLLLGRRGPAGQVVKWLTGVDVIFSFWGLVVAALVSGLPLMVKPIQAAVRGEVLALMEAAAVLGKPPLVVLRRVVLPSLRPVVVASLFLAIGRSLGEVGVSLMLGGNIVGKTNTISLEIYNAVFTGEFHRALLLTLLLGVVSLCMLAVVRRLHAASLRG